MINEKGVICIKRDLYVDFDQTIVNSVKAITTLYNEDFMYYKKFKPVSWCMVNTWDFLELTCAKPDYINTYFNQPRFYKSLEYMENAKETLDKLKEYFNIHIVSMGYSPNLALKKIWLKDCIPYADFIGVNFKEYDNKDHIDMSGGILIDDSAKNLETSNAETRICYGDFYEWNENYKGIRKWNWNEVYDFLVN